jgi:hypothetical protein
MSKIHHTQGLWKVVPSGQPDTFDIVCHNYPICLGASSTNVAVLVLAPAMFRLLSFFVDAVARGADQAQLDALASMGAKVLKQASDVSPLYGAIKR